MSSDPTAEVARLREEVRYHERKYRYEVASVISDSEYDRLMSRLKQLEAENPELITPDSPTQRVGSDLEDRLPKVAHRVPMLSIENTYSVEDLKEYGNRVAKLLPGEAVEWVVELKVDGVAVSLIYEDGLLVQCLNRGDGYTGNDITSNVLTVKDIPHRLLGENVPPLLEVRGEIYMTNSGLVQFNEKQKVKLEKGDRKAKLLKNVRNGVAGSITQDDPKICAERPLQFFCHSVGDTSGLQARNHIEFLREMANYGLPTTPMAERFATFHAAVDYCEEMIERIHELDFEIDGLVLKVNRFDHRERLGSTSKSPRWVVAYKFDKYEKVTRLNTIYVQVGKTGAITPVANLEPVELAGVTVSRASLHNADEIERKDIRPGDMVVVERAGKVIPHVVRVEKHLRPDVTELPKFVFPTECPDCGHRLVKDEGGVYIRCPNVQCPAQLKERIRYFASRNAMDIEGLGDELVNQLVTEKLLQSYGDIYRLGVDQLMKLETIEDLGLTRAETILKGIEDSKHFGLVWLLKALAPDAQIAKCAEALAAQFGSLTRIMQADLAQLSKVGGGFSVHDLHEWLHKDIGEDTVAELASLGVQMEPSNKDIKFTNAKRKSGDIKEKIGSFVSVERKVTDDKGKVRNGKMGFPLLGQERVNRLVDERLISSVADLYRLKVEELASIKLIKKWTRETAEEQLRLIAESKSRGLARLLNALSIRHVGSRVATVLAERFGSTDALTAASVAELSQTNEIGPIIGQSVHAFLHSKFGKETIEDLKGVGVKMESITLGGASTRALEGKTLVVTGTLQKYTRDEIDELIARHGGHAASSVSKNTDYLVAGEKAGSKLAKAQELGVSVISEAEFEHLLQQKR